MTEDHPFSAIEASLKKAVAALREAEVPFLLGGSLASWARGGPETRKDLDFMVKPEDAQRAQKALVDAGMQAEDPPEEWLLKAWDDGVLVDLIFETTAGEITDEVIARGEEREVASVRMRLMALGDVFVTKLLALNETHLDYESVLEMARTVREQVDWEDVHARTSSSPYARAFFTLVEELGIVESPSAAAGGG